MIYNRIKLFPYIFLVNTLVCHPAGFAQGIGGFFKKNFSVTVNGKTTGNSNGVTNTSGSGKGNARKGRDGIVHNEITNDVSLSIPEDQKLLGAMETRAEDIGNALHYFDLNNRFVKALNFRVIKRDQNNLPADIRFDLIRGWDLAKNFNEWSIDIIFQDGLPYIVCPAEHNKPHYNVKFPLNITNDGMYTVVQERQINSIYANYRKRYLDTNSSYQAIMKKLNSYPKEYDIHNCLAIGYYDVTLQKIVHVPSGVILGGDNMEFVDAGPGKIPFYKNISDHIVVIKAISRDNDYPDGNEFREASILLRPGQQTNNWTLKLFKIAPSYDDDSYHFIQYLGDPGNVKILEADK